MSKNTTAKIASGSMVVGVGTANKLIVNTHSSGVVRLVDSPNSASGRVILSDYTLPTGATILPLDLEFYEGVYLVIVSGSATVQLAYSI